MAKPTGIPIAPDASGPAPARQDTRAARIQSVAVFCGRSPGNHTDYLKSATDLGEAVALAGLQLVFGGGAEGIMCAVTDAALASGGRVLGIIPEFLIELEGLHPGPQRIIRTETLQDRKRAMYEHADAFVALPGGLGTLDEVLEVITWRQIALHDKPIIIVNVRGWADAFIATLEAAKASGFAGDETLHLFEVVPDVAAVLPRLGVSVGRGSAR